MQGVLRKFKDSSLIGNKVLSPKPLRMKEVKKNSRVKNGKQHDEYDEYNK